jgi:TRAP-type C4-dicarboxylate transport system permease small subunit
VIRTLRNAAEAVLVVMMAAMFVAFILQVVFRYVLNWPVGWTDEVCTLVWLWGILWGASFVMANREDIRFDMLYSHLPRPLRRGSTVVASAAFVALMAVSLPATWSYVSFMKVERTASFGLRYDWVFSVHLVFVLSMIVRHTVIVWDALARDRLVEDGHALGDGGSAV